MNYKELIKQIAQRSDLKEYEVKKVIKELNITIIESLLKLDTVQLQGICKLDPIVMPSKKITSNLRQQKVIIEIDDRVKIKFTTHKGLKELLKDVLIKKNKSIDVKEYFKQFNLD